MLFTLSMFWQYALMTLVFPLEFFQQEQFDFLDKFINNMSIIYNMVRPSMALVAILFLFGTALAEISESDNNARMAIDAQEIREKIETGEKVNYQNSIIRGDLDIQRLNLSRDTNRRSLVESPIVFTDCEFQGDVNFNSAVFNKSVNFDGTVFLGEVYMARSQLNSRASFVRSNFNMPVTFDDVAFRDEIFFRDAKFNRTASFVRSVYKQNAYFAGAIFENRAYFRDADFENDVLFDDAKFINSANFPNAIFGKNVSFKTAKFFEPSHFTDCIFRGDADFPNAEINNFLDFNNATFIGNVSFYIAQFRNTVEFVGSKFMGNAEFQDLKLQMPMDFSHAIFEKEARFNNSHFLDTAKFVSSTFKGNAQFRGARFDAPADFSNANFRKEARFDGAMFNKVVKFSNATFKGNVSFYNAYFERDARFDQAQFSSNLNLTGSTFYQLMLPWETIKDRIGKEKPTYLALIGNYRTLGWIPDRNGCYYQYRELKRIESKGWAKLLNTVSWAYWGYGIHWYYPFFWLLVIIASFGTIFYEVVRHKWGTIKKKATPEKESTPSSNRQADKEQISIIRSSETIEADLSFLDALRFSALAFKRADNFQIEGTLVRIVVWAERVVGVFFFLTFFAFLRDEFISYFKPPT